MTATFDSEAQRAVWETMQRLNAAWLHGEVDNLAEVLHPHMVIEPPGFHQRIEGAEACAAGYREFAAQAKVESYRESEEKVEVYGTTAVVNYQYDLTYLLDDARYQDAGHDLYVFAFEDGRWQAVWRTLLPLAGEAVSAE